MFPTCKGKVCHVLKVLYSNAKSSCWNQRYFWREKQFNIFDVCGSCLGKGLAFKVGRKENQIDLIPWEHNLLWKSPASSKTKRSVTEIVLHIEKRRKYYQLNVNCMSMSIKNNGTFRHHKKLFSQKSFFPGNYKKFVFFRKCLVLSDNFFGVVPDPTALFWKWFQKSLFFSD